MCLCPRECIRRARVAVMNDSWLRDTLLLPIRRSSGTLQGPNSDENALSRD